MQSKQERHRSLTQHAVNRQRGQRQLSHLCGGHPRRRDLCLAQRPGSRYNRRRTVLHHTGQDGLLRAKGKSQHKSLRCQKRNRPSSSTPAGSARVDHSRLPCAARGVLRAAPTRLAHVAVDVRCAWQSHSQGLQSRAADPCLFMQSPSYAFDSAAGPKFKLSQRPGRQIVASVP